MLLAALLLLGARGEPGPGPLPWRVGGPLGFTVDAASFPDSTDRTLEVYLRLPPATLSGLAHSDVDPSRLRLFVRLRNRFGARQHEASEEFTVAPGDTGAGFGKVAVLRFPVRSGTYQMLVRVEDPNTRKRGIAYMGRKITESAQVEGEVVVAPEQAGRSMSDLEFVWPGPAPTGAVAFRRGASGEETQLPNPERLYGVLATELRSAFVVKAPGGSERPWRWHARVFDPQGKAVVERESTLAASGPWLDASLALDVSTLPAGGYDLEVRAWQEGDPGAVVRRDHFSVAWLPGSWNRNPRDVEDDVHFLFDPDVEEAFARMHPGEQERALEDFWRERDPSPATAENEARIAFHKRVDYANKQWSRQGLVKGMFSDMGRVYIRYGEPDETHRQVIPAGDQTLLQVLQSLELSESRPTGDVHQKGLGGDTRPFEVWIYEGHEVAALLPSSPNVAPRSRKRLLFLFVDERGYGDYRLRYTTE